MSARARMISSAIVTDRRLATLSSPVARLLWIALVVSADSKGRLRGDPPYVRVLALPNEPGVTDEDIARWIGELEAQRLVVWYEVDSARYLQLLEWSEEGGLCQQRLGRPGKSPLPDPPGEPDPTPTAPAPTEERHDPEFPPPRTHRGGEMTRAGETIDEMISRQRAALAAEGK